jgi:hypothetical protein
MEGIPDEMIYSVGFPGQERKTIKEDAHDMIDKTFKKKSWHAGYRNGLSDWRSTFGKR